MCRASQRSEISFPVSCCYYLPVRDSSKALCGTPLCHYPAILSFLGICRHFVLVLIQQWEPGTPFQLGLETREPHVLRARWSVAFWRQIELLPCLWIWLNYLCHERSCCNFRLPYRRDMWCWWLTGRICCRVTSEAVCALENAWDNVCSCSNWISVRAKSALRSQLQPVRWFSRYHPGQHLYCSSRHLPSWVLHTDNPQWEASIVPPGAAELIGLIKHRAFSQPRDWAK